MLATAPTNFASSRNDIGGGICDKVELWCEEEEEMRFKFCHVPSLKSKCVAVLCLKGANGF